MDAGSIPAGSTLFFFPYAALNSASRLSHGPNVHSFDARLFALPTGKITGVVNAAQVRNRTFGNLIRQ